MSGRISDFSPADALTGGEQIEVLQDGENKKVTLAEVAALASPGLTVLAFGVQSVTDNATVASAIADYTLTGSEIVIAVPKRTGQFVLPTTLGPLSMSTSNPVTSTEGDAIAAKVDELVSTFNYLITNLAYVGGSLVQNGADVDLVLFTPSQGALDVFYFVILPS